jgi:hypothetical protein
MDLESWARWWDYTKAYGAMILGTDTDYASWHRVRADDKRCARLNCISHFLSQIPYEKIPFELGDIPEKKKRKKGIPDEVKFLHTVPEKF